jgi:hypothetical protein
MAPQCVQPAFGRLAIKTGTSPYTWSGGTRLRYYRENLKFRGRIVHPNTITGSLQENSERARQSAGVYRGIVTFPINPADMVTLLPLVLGGTPAGTTFPYAETVPTFGCLVDKVSQVFQYVNGVANRMIIHGVQGGPEGAPPFITCAIEMIFKDENGGQTWDAALTSLPVTAAYTDFIFSDTTITLLGVSRTPKEFSLLIDRHIDPRYVASTKPTLLCPADFTCVMQARFPFDADHQDLHGYPLAGQAGSLALTNGTISTTFNFGCLQTPDETPENHGKRQGEIDITKVLVARKLGSTDSVTAVNDSTP